MTKELFEDYQNGKLEDGKMFYVQVKSDGDIFYSIEKFNFGLGYWNFGLWDFEEIIDVLKPVPSFTEDTEKEKKISELSKKCKILSDFVSWFGEIDSNYVEKTTKELKDDISKIKNDILSLYVDKHQKKQ